MQLVGHYVRTVKRERERDTTMKKQMLPRERLVRVWMATVILLLAASSLRYTDSVQTGLDNHGSKPCPSLLNYQFSSLHLYYFCYVMLIILDHCSDANGNGRSHLQGK